LLYNDIDKRAQFQKKITGSSLSFTLEEVNMANKSSGKPVQQGGKKESEIIEQIKKLAYEKFMKRGYQHGHEMEDWLAAEKEIRSGK
jgi:hypothetical protein